MILFDIYETGEKLKKKIVKEIKNSSESKAQPHDQLNTEAFLLLDKMGNIEDENILIGVKEDNSEEAKIICSILQHK